MARGAPDWTGDWYICCPAYENSIGSGENFRCTEVLLVKATSEEEAATKVFAADEGWYGAIIVLAEPFLNPNPNLPEAP